MTAIDGVCQGDKREGATETVSERYVQDTHLSIA